MFENRAIAAHLKREYYPLIFSYDFDKHFSSKRALRWASEKGYKLHQRFAELADIKDFLTENKILEEHERPQQEINRLRDIAKSVNIWPYAIDPKEFIDASGNIDTDTVIQIMAKHNVIIGLAFAEKIALVLLDSENRLKKAPLLSLWEIKNFKTDTITSAIARTKRLDSEQGIFFQDYDWDISDFITLQVPANGEKWTVSSTIAKEVQLNDDWGNHLLTIDDNDDVCSQCGQFMTDDPFGGDHLSNCINDSGYENEDSQWTYQPTNLKKRKPTQEKITDYFN